jgi:hypothetical protein
VIGLHSSIIDERWTLAVAVEAAKFCIELGFTQTSTTCIERLAGAGSAADHGRRGQSVQGHDRPAAEPGPAGIGHAVEYVLCVRAG